MQHTKTFPHVESSLNLSSRELVYFGSSFFFGYIKAISWVQGLDWTFKRSARKQEPFQVKFVVENDDYSNVFASNFLYLEDLSVQDLRSSG